MGDSTQEKNIYQENALERKTHQDAIPALGKGSAKPTFRKYVTVLYSLRFSPYCQRVRLILNQKNHPFQLVNINIWDKPEFFVGMTELNQVPVMVCPDGNVFSESLIIAEFIDSRFAGKRLLSLDPYQKAREKMLVSRIMDLISDPVRNLAFHGDRRSVEGLLKTLDKVEAILQENYFFSEKVGFVDLMVYPWFDRIPAYLKLAGSSWDEVAGRCPKIAAWRSRLLEEPYVQQASYSDEAYVASVQMRRSHVFDPDVALNQ